MNPVLEYFVTVLPYYIVPVLVIVLLYVLIGGLMRGGGHSRFGRIIPRKFSGSGGIRYGDGLSGINMKVMKDDGEEE
jgi:hypothetical protein